jgi:zinc protease
MFRVAVSCLLLCLCACDQRSAKEPPLQIECPKPLFGTKTKTLSNGLQVVVLEEHSSPRVSIGVLYKVGSADDPEDLSGLSHMLEHLIFYGAPKYPDVRNEIGLLGGTCNAFTHQDYTFATFHCHSKKLGMIFDIEADILSNFCISDERFNTEKNVVQEERALRIDDAYLGLFHEFIDNSLSPQHPYGRSGVGMRHHITAFTKDAVMNHFKKWYIPSNVVVLVFGDVITDEVFAEAERAFGSIKSVDAPNRVRPKNSITQLQYEITYEQSGDDISRVRLIYNAPHFKRDGKIKCYAMMLAMDALFSTFSDFRKYFFQRKRLTGLSTNYVWDSFDPQRLSIGMTLSKGIDSAKFLKEFYSRLKRTIDRGLTQEEFSLAKNGYLVLLSMKLRDGVKGALSTFEKLGVGATVEDLESAAVDVNSVTLKQVNAVLKEFFGSKPYAVVNIVPDKKKK